MINSIFLALDSSPHGAVAATYANYLAYKLDATLDLAYVVDSRLTQMTYWTDYGAISVPMRQSLDEIAKVLEEQGKSLLEEASKKASEANLTVRTHLLQGLPSASIVTAAQDSDMIVLGRRGESSELADESGLGSVAERVLRNAKHPVFCTPGKFYDMKRIVLGFDGSDRAHVTMTYAVGLAKQLGLNMLVVSVSDDEDTSTRRLNTAKAYAEDNGLSVLTSALEGDPVEGLLASLQQGDVLAIGAFGEGRVREWLLGSTTEALLRQADYPVLLHR